MAGDPFCDRDYEALATFRYELRRFVRFSEKAANAAGLTPQHYQVLLTLRASPDGAMLVGALAGRLLLRPHSRSEEHTSELQSLMRISYAVFSLKQKT